MTVSKRGARPFSKYPEGRGGVRLTRLFVFQGQVISSGTVAESGLAGEVINEMSPEDRKQESFLRSRPVKEILHFQRKLGPYAGLLFVVLVSIWLWQDYKNTQVPFTIVFNGRPYVRWTHQKTVDSALLDAGIKLASYDIVIPEPSSPLHPYDTVTIRKAFALLIEADGQSIECYTHKQTAAEIFADVGIAFTEHDDILARGQKISSQEDIFPTDTGQPAIRNPDAEEIPPWSQMPAAPVRLVLKRAAILHVDDGGIPSIIYSTATTIGEALRDHDIILYLGDRVNPSLGSRVSTGLKVYIQRSKAVELAADGHSLHTRTRGETVADVLAQQRVALIGNDFVEPEETTLIQDGMGIRVSRISKSTIIEQETIPFETVWQAAADIEIDNQRVEQDGTEGLSKRRIHVAYQDGLEIARDLEDEWLENEPQTKIIAYGTQIIPRELDTGSEKLTYWRKFRALATSYSPASSGKSPDHPQYGITFTGVPVQKGIIAADPTVVGLNSSLYVPGYGAGKVADTGGGIKGRWIDLGYEDESLVMWYRWTDVYVLGDPPPRDQIRWVLPNWPREGR